MLSCKIFLLETGLLFLRITQLLESENINLMAQVDALIEQACANGGVDNISVILARVIGSDISSNKGD